MQCDRVLRMAVPDPSLYLTVLVYRVINWLHVFDDIQCVVTESTLQMPHREHFA